MQLPATDNYPTEACNNKHVVPNKSNSVASNKERKTTRGAADTINLYAQPAKPGEKCESTNSNETKVAKTVLPESEKGNLWTQNQQKILEWALTVYPKGTGQRWEKIAEHIPGKTKVVYYHLKPLVGHKSAALL